MERERGREKMSKTTLYLSPAGDGGRDQKNRLIKRTEESVYISHVLPLSLSLSPTYVCFYLLISLFEGGRREESKYVQVSFSSSNSEAVWQLVTTQRGEAG